MTDSRPTMSDVAILAGVSKSTVSHVLNHTRFVSPETTLLVEQAISDLGYRPSMIARSLAAQHTNTIGLIISDLDNPFYPQVIKGVEEVALSHSYNVFLANVGYDTQRIISSVRSLLDHQIDGAICMSTHFPEEMLEVLAEHKLPTVFVDWKSSNHILAPQHFTNLTINFNSGIEHAVRHLLELGHSRFAHISGPHNAWTAQQRQAAFLQALGQHGISREDIFIVEGDLKISGGRRALHAILEQPTSPTAVFAANDLMALGFLWEARALHTPIPEEFSVVGLDNISLSSQITPGLTTVSLPIHEIGRQAVSSLLQLISTENNSGTSPPDQLATHLIIRDSTATPAERKSDGL